ncbi:hypothetical protein [Pontibacillus litoralis]|uniref:Uncharacterized protein n=1 Tax=Pontibacillus litoralis JSM 072002 TaxID=1385512 RepID=A0A0A5GA35_9BACI|nr:hypothetical protein [Pontibacillus litoralis]KGX88038.1 hypothetical protein N784_13060 [Pontibacillus litoralis JSM 072002]
MPRVRIEFDTDLPSDGKVFVNGKEISLIRYINLYSSCEDRTKLVISRLIDDGNGNPVTGEYGFLEETYDVFEKLKTQDKENGKKLEDKILFPYNFD